MTLTKAEKHDVIESEYNLPLHKKYAGGVLFCDHVYVRYLRAPKSFDEEPESAGRYRYRYWRDA